MSTLASQHSLCKDPWLRKIKPPTHRTHRTHRAWSRSRWLYIDFSNASWRNINNQKSADPTEGTGIKGPEPPSCLLNPLLPSTPPTQLDRTQPTLVFLTRECLLCMPWTVYSHFLKQQCCSHLQLGYVRWAFTSKASMPGTASFQGHPVPGTVASEALHAQNFYSPCQRLPSLHAWCLLTMSHCHGLCILCVLCGRFIFRNRGPSLKVMVTVMVDSFCFEVVVPPWWIHDVKNGFNFRERAVRLRVQGKGASNLASCFPLHHGKKIKTKSSLECPSTDFHFNLAKDCTACLSVKRCDSSWTFGVLFVF